MRFRPLLAVLFFSTASLAVTPLFGAATEPSSQPSDRVLAEYKIEHWGEPILIPVVWNDKPACFILDTNAGLSVLNASDFPNLAPFNKSVDLGTAGGQRKMQMSHGPDLHVGPFSLADSGPVLRLDVSDLRGLTGRPVIGLLGVSAIAGAVVQVDFDQHRVRFLRPDNQPHPEWGKAIPMRPDARHSPAVHLTFLGVEGNFEIDTGNTGCIDLPSEAFNHLRDLSKQAVISTPHFTGNGNVMLGEMRLPDLDLAGLHYHDLICGETKLTSGTLGLEFLERHLVTMDFPNNRLYLKPGKEFDHQSEINMAGIHAEQSNNRLIAKFVDAGSPAYQAGIRDGDILISLNGKPASDYEMPDVRDLMCAGDGKEIAVSFRRGEIQQTVKFKLRRAI